MGERPEVETAQFRVLSGRDQNFVLTEQTYLIRYMKLSTFILLLANKVFIPSIQTLQTMDKLESRISEQIWPDGYWEQLLPLLEPHEQWLLSKAKYSKAKYPLFLRPPGQEHFTGSLRFLGETWLRELAIRRSIWCWNRYEEESYALWNSYGERGVAIVSSVGNVKKAIERAGPYAGIVAPIEYIFPQHARHHNQTQFSDALLTTTLENLRRPYLFKDSGYRFEGEIRFVFGIHPELTEMGGALIDVDSASLVLDLRFSPKIQEDEKKVIYDLAMRVMRAQEVTLSLPPSPDEGFLPSLKIPRRNPFEREEGLPDLFSDLQ